MKKNIYVVNHTHWDREWQKTFHEYRCRLIGFMDEVITVLTENEKFTSFMLDGQTSLVLDYLEIKPEQYEVIKNLVSSGRLLIGPWYVQPDEFLPSGESLLRNLLIGERISRKFGNKMKIGYLPDSFGQSKNIPQILNAFDIDSVVAMRGFHKEDIPNNEFVWRGSAESKVITSILWASYNNGSQLVENIDHAEKFIKFNIDTLEQGATEGQLLFLAGSDQARIKGYMPELLEKMNHLYEDKEIHFKFATLQEYIDSVKEYTESMPIYEGDFRKGHKQRVHISIAGTRTDIKQLNYDIQTKLERKLEPMSVIGYTLDDRYEKELIEKMWMMIIQNHAHDSICCVCTDEAHKDMINRMFEANEMYKALIKSRICNLMEKIQFKKDGSRPVVVLNTNSFKIEQIVTATVDSYDDFGLYTSGGEKIPYDVVKEERINLKDYRLWLKENPDDFVTRKTIAFNAEVEGIGFRTYYIKEKETQIKETSPFIVKKHSLSNGLVTINVAEDGSVSIYDDISKKSVKKTFNIIESGNAGDEYDFSPPKQDKSYSSKLFTNKVEIKTLNNYQARVIIETDMEVNKDTNAEKRSEEIVMQKVTRIFKVSKGSRLIELDVVVNNQARNHRVSLAISNFSKSYHAAECSFGDDKRQNDFGHVIEDTASEWKEYYYPIYSTQRYVYGDTLAVFNKGVPSYEIKDKEDLLVHMLTTMDYMGKKDLLFRQGRRSGAKINTPDSLMMGEHRFEFAILLHEHDHLVSQYADVFQNQLMTHYVHKPNALGLVSDEQLFFTVIDNEVTTSALLANQLSCEDAIIWRIKNMTDQPLSNIKLQYNPNFYQFKEEINMLEEPTQNNRVKKQIKADYIGEEYEGSGSYIDTGLLTIQTVKPNEIINLRFNAK